MAKLRTAAAILSATLLLPAFFAPSAFAQTQESLKVQPAIIEQQLSSQQVFPTSLRATNLTGADQTYFLEVRDITNINENGQPNFADPGQALDTGVSSWITLGEKSVTLKAGETKEVPFTITVPKDAYPGGHFGGVFLSTQAQQPKENGSGVAFEIGTILNVRVAGEATVEARIREFRSDKSVYSNEPVQFSTRVEDLGNVLIRPQGFVEVSNMFGKKLATLDVNTAASGIFPKSDRGFAVTWNPGTLAFGRYEAILSLSYGDEGKKTITSSLSLWIFPLKIIIPAIVILLVLVVGGYLALQWYIRKRMRELTGGRTAERVPAQRPFPRLLFLTLATLCFTLVFLLVLFVIFSAA